MRSTLPTSILLIFTITLLGKGYYYLFTDIKTEAQRSSITGQRSHSLDSNPGLLVQQTGFFWMNLKGWGKLYPQQCTIKVSKYAEESKEFFREHPPTPPTYP